MNKQEAIDVLIALACCTMAGLSCLWAPGQPRGCGEQRIDFCCKCYESFVSFLECSQ